MQQEVICNSLNRISIQRFESQLIEEFNNLGFNPLKKDFTSTVQLKTVVLIVKRCLARESIFATSMLQKIDSWKSASFYMTEKRVVFSYFIKVLYFCWHYIVHTESIPWIVWYFLTNKMLLLYLTGIFYYFNKKLFLTFLERYLHRMYFLFPDRWSYKKLSKKIYSNIVSWNSIYFL